MARTAYRFACLALAVTGAIAPLLVNAQEQAQDQEELAKQATQSPDTLLNMLTLGVGLLAVIAIIYGCAWIVRRMNGLTGMNNQAIKVVSVMALGARERIALIEVGGKQVLIGVTPSTIRTLHVFDEPVVSADNTSTSDFARRLQGMIGKSWSSKSSRDDS